MRFLSALMPREARFFALFNKHAELIVEGGTAVLELVRDYADLERRAALIQRIGEVERAADELKERFEPVRSALQGLVDGLKPLANVISQIAALLDVMDREPFRSALRVMSQVRNAVQKLYDKVSKAAFKYLVKPLLKSLGINADRVRAFFDGLLKKLDPMRLIKPWLDQAKRQITKAVEKMAVVRAIRALLEKLDDKLAQLERAVLAFLNSACRKVLCDEAVA